MQDGGVSRSQNRRLLAPGRFPGWLVLPCFCPLRLSGPGPKSPNSGCEQPTDGSWGSTEKTNDVSFYVFNLLLHSLYKPRWVTLILIHRQETFEPQPASEMLYKGQRKPSQCSTNTSNQTSMEAHRPACAVPPGPSPAHNTNLRLQSFITNPFVNQTANQTANQTTPPNKPPSHTAHTPPSAQN